MVQIQGYQQRIDLGSSGGTPGVQPSLTRTGLGEAIQEGAQNLERARLALEHSQNQTAHANATGAVSDLNLSMEQEFQQAKEQAKPGAPDFAPSVLKRYDDEVVKRAEKLPDDATRKVFQEKTAAARDEFGIRAMHWEGAERQRNRVDQFTKSTDADANQLMLADSGSRASLYASQGQAFNQSIEQMALEPGAKQALIDENRNKRSVAAVQADIRDRPENVQDWVMGKGAAEGGYYSKLRQSESGGRNIGSGTSSAFGPYQFTKGTWSAVVSAHPDLGLTESDRFSSDKQEIAIRPFTQDNLATLKKAGIAPTPLNAKMAHLLGAGGAIGFLKANPADAATAHVSPAAVAANGALFRQGRTVGDVLALFGKQFPIGPIGAEGAPPPYYADIAPEKRDALYAHAETEMNKRRVQGNAAFDQRVQNSISEFAATGAASAPPTEAEFVAAKGVNVGTTAYGEFQANSAGAAAAYKVQYLPQDQVNDFVEAQRPKPGDAFFAEKQKAFAQVVSEVGKLTKERADDPAAVVARQQPAAAKSLMDGVTTNNPEALAQWVASARASGSDRILPNSVRETLVKSLGRTPSDTVEADAVWLRIKQQKQAWGENWPAVLREIGEQGGDLRVLGTVDEPTAIKLLANKKTTVHDIGKVLPPASLKGNEGYLQPAFENYAKSLRLPGEDGAPFYAAAQKLAALALRDGDTSSSSDAATVAYNKIIGDRYVFEGVTRVPKVHEALVSALEPARTKAIEGAAVTNLPAGVSPEDAKAWMRKETQWVTMPGDEGVVLMHGSIAARDTAGNVIVRSWRDLGAIEAEEARKPKPHRITGTQDAMRRSMGQ